MDNFCSKLFHRYAFKGSPYTAHLHPGLSQIPTQRPATEKSSTVNNDYPLSRSSLTGTWFWTNDARSSLAKPTIRSTRTTNRHSLAYQIGVEQLFGADDDTVLDIFHRINAYGLSLNAQELRHGKFQGGRFQGEFRWAVIRVAERWEILWSKYKVVTVRSRVRLLHHELVAQLLGIVLEGVTDGGQPKINKLYEHYDSSIPEDTEERLDQACRYIVDHFSVILTTKLGNGPHFMMMFAAVAHALFEIPKGDMRQEHGGMPQIDPRALSDIGLAHSNLMTLADLFDMSADEVPQRLASFKVAIAGTTQRIRSRSVRFQTMFRALLPDPI